MVNNDELEFSDKDDKYDLNQLSDIITNENNSHIQSLLSDIENSDAYNSQITKKRKKIEDKLRKKYIRYIKRNKYYKYDDFDNVAFISIRDIYFSEKSKRKNRFNELLKKFLQIFTI